MTRPRTVPASAADGRGWRPTPRTPLGAALTDDEIIELINTYGRPGKRRNAQVERNVVTVWRALVRLAHVERSGHVATSRPQLIRTLCDPADGIPKWHARGDDEANERHYGTQLTDWLRLLVAAGLVERAGGVRRGDGSWWRTEIVLRDRASIAAAVPGSSIGRAFGC